MIQKSKYKYKYAYKSKIQIEKRAGTVTAINTLFSAYVIPKNTNTNTREYKIYKYK